MKNPPLAAIGSLIAAFILGSAVGYSIPAADPVAPSRLIFQTPPACFEALKQTNPGPGFEADRLACLKYANN